MELPVSLPNPTKSEAGRDGRRRAAARSRGHAVQRVGVAGVAGQNRIHGLIGTERPLRHVRFRQHQRARLLDALHLERVLLGQIAGEGQRAVGGLQALGLEIVLHDHRHAMQRPRESGLREAPVKLLGLLLHVRIQRPRWN